MTPVTRGDTTVSDAVTRATRFVTQAAPGNGGTSISVRGLSVPVWKTGQPRMFFLATAPFCR